MSNRLPGVEGLRAIAAAAVLLHHVQLFGRDGPVSLAGPMENVFRDLRWGLVLFFVLSGFLLFRPFAAAIVAGRALPSARTYARNRALRILPAYWVILLVVCIVGVAAVWGGDGTGRPAPGVLLSDLLLVQNYHPDSVLTGIGPAWSLAVEVVFYAVLPVLGIGAAAMAARSAGPRGRVPAAFGAAALLVVIGVVGKAFFTAEVVTGPWRFVVASSFPVHSDLFGYGMAAAVVHVLAVDRGLRLPASWRGLALVAAGALLVIAHFAAPRLDVEAAGRPGDIGVGIACALLLVTVCVPATQRTRLQRVLELRPVVWVGLVSYSIYLWHMPVILWLGEHGVDYSGDKSLLIMIALAAAVTVVLSALTWRFVEAPALARKGRHQPTAEPAPQVV